MTTEEELFQYYMKKNPKASKKEIQDVKKYIKINTKIVDSHLTW